MTIDREVLLWLVSTAPQVLAALTGLSLTALTFRVSSFDDLISRDDTMADVLGGLKKDHYKKFKWVVIFSISIIAIDLFYIHFAEWVLECSNRLFWLISIFFLLNLLCLLLLCYFPLNLVNPNNQKRVIDKLVKEYDKGNNSTDAGDFIMHYRELERNLRDLFPYSNNEKSLTTYEMIRELRADKLINEDQFYDLIKLNKLRNYIVHEPDIQKVDNGLYDMLLRYIQIVDNLKERPVSAQ